MTTSSTAKIGFLSPVSADEPHFKRLRSLVPQGVQLDIVTMGLVRQSLADAKDQTDTILERATGFIKQYGWEGAVLLGAPIEVQNPGVVEKLQSAVDIPVTSALASGAAALKAFGARRALLMTPFDEHMNAMIRDYLTRAGIESLWPPKEMDLPSYKDAVKLGPEDVYARTQQVLATVQDAQGIYFQGAPLDPLPILERLEEGFLLPVVASNLAMLWHILTITGHRYHVEGWGRLLRDWPLSA